MIDRENEPPVAVQNHGKLLISVGFELLQPVWRTGRNVRELFRKGQGGQPVLQCPAALAIRPPHGPFVGKFSFKLSTRERKFHVPLVAYAFAAMNNSKSARAPI